MTNVPDDMKSPLDAELDAELLDRYLAGRCSAADWRRIDRWSAGDPQRRAVLLGLRRGMTSSIEYPTLPDATRTAERLRALQANARVQFPRAHTRGRFLRDDERRHTWSRWAWSGVTAAVVALGVFLVRDRAADSRATNVHQYHTATAQRAEVTLGDGTRMILAPRSSARVSTSPLGGRVVWLDGEAYFEVAHAGLVPFVVRTGGIETRVLGTRFVVHRYTGDMGVRVAVSSGKVSVQARGAQRPSVTLTAGGVGLVTDSSAVTLSQDDGAQYAGWVQGQLLFHDVSTSEVLATLTRWYGYQFRVADSAIVRQTLTAGISTRSATEALATLKAVLGVELTFNGNIITLIPRPHRALKGETLQREMLQRVNPSPREVGR